MKQVFFGLLALLLVASALIYWSMPEQRFETPVIYWMTGRNPERVEQVRLFQEWVGESEAPECVLILDTANNAKNKKMIQGVSGVASDLIDTIGMDLPMFHAMGMASDLTEEALRLGFDPSQTFDSVGPIITIDGRQYAYPCNVAVWLLWVNLDVFRRFGVQPPPKEWDFETFERIGKDFVRRANEGLERQKYFFSESPSPRFLWAVRRSVGVSAFNETGTRSGFHSPEYARVLRLLHKWTYEDHLFPSAGEAASFSTESGFGGSRFQLFHDGQYASITIARYVLIQLRKMDPVDLTSVYHPADRFTNAIIDMRGAFVYAGSRRRRLAPWFLAFLASEPYNRQIIASSDSMPPNPKYTETEDYLHPPGYPNENDVHAMEARAAREKAVSIGFSPFALPTVVARLEAETLELVMADRMAPEEAVARLARQVDEEIQRNIAENPRLKARHEEALVRQREIDRRLREGVPVDPETIDNPFLRRYLLFTGGARGGGPAAVDPGGNRGSVPVTMVPN